jgi:hypothetical protein
VSGPTVAELAAAGVLTGLAWRPAGLAAAAGMTLLLLGALANPFTKRARFETHQRLPAPPSPDAVPQPVPPVCGP